MGALLDQTLLTGQRNLPQSHDQVPVFSSLCDGRLCPLTVLDRRTRGLSSVHPATSVLHRCVLARLPTPALGSALWMKGQRLPCLVHRLARHF